MRGGKSGKRLSAASLVWMLALLTGGCVDTVAPTQVIVVVSSNLQAGSELDALEIRLLDRDELGNDTPAHGAFSIAESPIEGQHTLPLSFSVAPKDPASDEDFRLVVTGMLEGQNVVEQQVVATFRPGRSVQLGVFLDRSCLDELCREGAARTERACQAATGSCGLVRPTVDLTEWRGDGSELEVMRAQDAGVRPASVSCPPGFDREDDRCVDIDECDHGTPCGSAPCTNASGGYACGECERGYGPQDTDACADIDECVAGTDNCDAHADCVNTPGSFSCHCRERDGYEGSGTECNDIDECADPSLHDCDMEPFACVNRAPDAGRYICACAKGYGGSGRGEQGCVPLPTDLLFGMGTLLPEFDPAVTEYALDLGMWHERVSLIVPLEPGPNLRIDGTSQSPGARRELPLSMGANSIEVEVSQGSFARTYAIDVMRGSPAIRYVKAADIGPGDGFGASVALSSDGLTMAVGAYLESSSTHGVDTEPNDDAPLAGAVYVFERGVSRWSQVAYLKASNAGEGDRFGWSVSLNADGSVLAIGALHEASSTVGGGLRARRRGFPCRCGLRVRAKRGPMVGSGVPQGVRHGCMGSVWLSGFTGRRRHDTRRGREHRGCGCRDGAERPRLGSRLRVPRRCRGLAAASHPTGRPTGCGRHVRMAALAQRGRFYAGCGC